MHAHARSLRGASQGRVQQQALEELEERRVRGPYGEEDLSPFSQLAALQGLTWAHACAQEYANTQDHHAEHVLVQAEEYDVVVTQQVKACKKATEWKHQVLKLRCGSYQWTL